MDTITHGIAGALIGKALFHGEDLFTLRPMTRERVVAWSAMIGAIFPDADTFRDVFSDNPLLVLTWHRSITHSLLMLPVFALSLAALTRWVSRRFEWESPSFALLASVYAVGILSHILLDLCNNFGTMIWSPIFWSRPAWDLVFILDFSLSGILLLPQFLASLYREKQNLPRRGLFLWSVSAVAVLFIQRVSEIAGYPISALSAGSAIALLCALIFLPAWHGWGFGISRAGWCRAGLLAATAYIGATLPAHHFALKRASEFASFEHLEVASLAALPQPPSLWRWDGLIGTPRGIYALRMDLSETAPSPDPAAQSTIEYRYYPDAPDNPLIQKARQTREVQTVLWFARFPVTRFHMEGDIGVMEISDLRFPSPQRGGASPFTYRVRMDSAGRILSQGWVRQ